MPMFATWIVVGVVELIGRIRFAVVGLTLIAGPVPPDVPLHVSVTAGETCVPALLTMCSGATCGPGVCGVQVTVTENERSGAPAPAASQPGPGIVHGEPIWKLPS